MNNNDNQQGYVFNCSRCGAEMNSNSRYCMKCGNLNYNHEANQSMRKFMNKEENQFVTYHVGSTEQVNNFNVEKNAPSFANNTGSALMCFFVNYGLYIFIMIINIMSTINGTFSISSLVNIKFISITLIVSICFMYIYSFELIYMKCNKRWWSCLIPIYNFFELADITFGKKALGLVMLIPGINILFSIIMIYKLGKKFNYNGFLTLLLPIIFIPIIGFGSSSYDGKNYIFGNQKAIERDYLVKKIFQFSLLFFILLGSGLFVYDNKNNVQYYKRQFLNIYYVYASKKIVNKVESKIKKNFYSCDNSKIGGTDIYYFYFPDLGKKVYLPGYYSRDAIEAYVKVDNTTGKYYVSISDGTYGFSETDLDSLNTKTVVEYNAITNDFGDSTMCEFGS